MTGTEDDENEGARQLFLPVYSFLLAPTLFLASCFLFPPGFLRHQLSVACPANTQNQDTKDMK
jgi:hypothetical protein